eukprot:SAG31_NODE_14097_length_827_cov_1.414835_1_plen_264_part_10
MAIARAFGIDHHFHLPLPHCRRVDPTTGQVADRNSFEFHHGLEAASALWATAQPAPPPQMGVELRTAVHNSDAAAVERLLATAPGVLSVADELDDARYGAKCSILWAATQVAVDMLFMAYKDPSNAPTQAQHDAALAVVVKVASACQGEGSALERPGPCPDSTTPLRNACFAGHADCVRALLDAGADPKTTGSAAGETPLTAAASGGYHDVVGLLLAAGAPLPDQNAVEHATTGRDHWVSVGGEHEAAAFEEVLRLLATFDWPS